MFIEEAIQIAVTICPLVVTDFVGNNTVILYFLKESGAEEFIAELEARNGNKFQAIRANKEVMVTAI